MLTSGPQSMKISLSSHVNLNIFVTVIFAYYSTDSLNIFVTTKFCIWLDSEACWKICSNFLSMNDTVSELNFASIWIVGWKLFSWNESILHYSDVIMGALASQITSLTIVYSAVYSGADERKHQSSASLALCGEFTDDWWIPRTNGQ